MLQVPFREAWASSAGAQKNTPRSRARNEKVRWGNLVYAFQRLYSCLPGGYSPSPEATKQMRRLEPDFIAGMRSFESARAQFRKLENDVEEEVAIRSKAKERTPPGSAAPSERLSFSPFHFDGRQFRAPSPKARALAILKAADEQLSPPTHASSPPTLPSPSPEASSAQGRSSAAPDGRAMDGDADGTSNPPPFSDPKKPPPPLGPPPPPPTAANGRRLSSPTTSLAAPPSRRSWWDKGGSSQRSARSSGSTPPLYSWRGYSSPPALQEPSIEKAARSLPARAEQTGVWEEVRGQRNQPAAGLITEWQRAVEADPKGAFMV